MGLHLQQKKKKTLNKMRLLIEFSENYTRLHKKIHLHADIIILNELDPNKHRQEDEIEVELISGETKIVRNYSETGLKIKCTIYPDQTK